MARRPTVAEVALQAGARSADIEDMRRLPADLVSAMSASGMPKLWVAEAYEGSQATVQHVINTIADVSYQDASTG